MADKKSEAKPVPAVPPPKADPVDPRPEAMPTVLSKNLDPRLTSMPIRVLEQESEQRPKGEK